jgi:pimeloyl-ACP methyl ester carboxylesterase
MSDFALPETRYALSGDVNIAYQVMGDGPVDIILVPGFISHIEFRHELPGYTAFLRHLSTFARVVSFDKRGQGLSDRVSDAPSLEQRMDDVRAIMDAIGSQRATLFGHSEGCAMSALFAATYPDRVSSLILFAGYVRRPDLNFDDVLRERVTLWGTGAMMKRAAPSLAADPDDVAAFAKLERLSASPGAVKSFTLLNLQIDVGFILPAVRVPTLVLHRQTDALVPIELGRELAARIPGAKYIEYPDGDHTFWTGDVETLHGDIEEFLTGHRESSPIDFERVLATVLFTDIVDSTRSAAAMGDRAWRRLLDSHDQLAIQTSPSIAAV